MYNSIYMANAYVSKFYNHMLDLNAYDALMNCSKEEFSSYLQNYNQNDVIPFMHSQIDIDTWYNNQVHMLSNELEEFQADWMITILTKREELIKLNIMEDYDIHILKYYNSLLSNSSIAIQEYAKLLIDRWFLIALYQNVQLDESYYIYANGYIPQSSMIELFEHVLDRNHYLKGIYEDLETDDDTAKLEHSFDSYISKQMYQYIMDVQNENALFAYAFFKHQEIKNVRMIVKAKLYYVDSIKQRQLLRYHYG